MAGLGPSGILTAWETGQGRRPLDRALCILWAAGMTGPIADWPLIVRDRALLETRRQVLGDRLTLMTTCEECAAELEIETSVAALVDALADPSGTKIVVGGAEIVIRPLTSADIAIFSDASPEDLPDLTRARLVGEVERSASSAVDAEIERCLQDAELRFSLHCPDCGAGRSEPLDVADVVWREIEITARRLLNDVADLASAFGWREPDVLALSAARRGAYLSLARAK